MTVICVSFFVLLITSNIKDDKSRYHQHLEESGRLPLVTIDTGGQEIPGSDGGSDYITGHILIRGQEENGNELEIVPTLDTDMKLHVRGHSSRHFPKKNYIVKFLDGSQYRNASVWGMEENSDWVLHGPYLDKTLIRNYMWYNISGEVMDWAPDVRFCEMVLNGEYQGVYVLTESVDVAEGRLDLTSTSKHAYATSYVVHMDRKDEDEREINHFTNYTYMVDTGLMVEYPGKQSLTKEKIDYIEKDISRFEKALYSYDYDTVKYGYRNFIDVESFVDYFLINEFTQNYDAGTYSTYLYKDLRGKLKLAVWDFNNCCDNYQEVAYDGTGFSMQDRVWFKMLMRDEKFTDRIISRYKELRETYLNEEYLLQYIDDTVAFLGDATERNYQVWNQSFSDNTKMSSLIPEDRNLRSYDEAVDQLKSFIVTRGRWMDDNIESLKQFSHESKNKHYNH